MYATWASKRVRLQGDHKHLKDLTVLDNIFVYFICLLDLTYFSPLKMFIIESITYVSFCPH